MKDVVRKEVEGLIARLTHLNYLPAGCSVEEFQDKINWPWLSYSVPLSEPFIREFGDKLDWFNISWDQDLSESLIRDFQHKVCWGGISLKQTLSEPFIREFQAYVNWDYIFYGQKLSEEFKKEFEHKRNPQAVCSQISTLTISASAEEPLLVINNSDKNGRPGGVVVFIAGRAGAEVHIMIPPGSDPVDLSDKLDRETLLESVDFNRLVERGYLTLMGSPVVTKQAEPKNNDGREACFWCQSRTKQVQSIFSVYNVCTKCGR